MSNSASVNGEATLFFTITNKSAYEVQAAKHIKFTDISFVASGDTAFKVMHFFLDPVDDPVEKVDKVQMYYSYKVDGLLMIDGKVEDDGTNKLDGNGNFTLAENRQVIVVSACIVYDVDGLKYQSSWLTRIAQYDGLMS